MPIQLHINQKQETWNFHENQVINMDQGTLLENENKQSCHFLHATLRTDLFYYCTKYMYQ